MLAALLIFAGAADANGNLRCKGRIINVGKTDAEVLALCGEPTSRISSAVPVRAGVKSGFTRFVGYSTSEQWVFDRGWGRFPAVLFFDHGRIQRIDFLPYRSGDL